MSSKASLRTGDCFLTGRDQRDYFRTANTIDRSECHLIQSIKFFRIRRLDEASAPTASRACILAAGNHLVRQLGTCLIAARINRPACLQVLSQIVFLWRREANDKRCPIIGPLMRKQRPTEYCFTTDSAPLKKRKLSFEKETFPGSEAFPPFLGSENPLERWRHNGARRCIGVFLVKSL